MVLTGCNNDGSSVSMSNGKSKAPQNQGALVHQRVTKSVQDKVFSQGQSPANDRGNVSPNQTIPAITHPASTNVKQVHFTHISMETADKGWAIDRFGSRAAIYWTNSSGKTWNNVSPDALIGNEGIGFQAIDSGTAWIAIPNQREGNKKNL